MLSIARKLNLTAKDSLSIGMETNSKGFLGFIIELPGAYVKGPTQIGAVSKTVMEAGSYLTWLGQENVRFPEPLIVQTHRSDLKIEDADCEILLDDDRRPMNEDEFGRLVELVRYSGLAFDKLYESTGLKDWVDEDRIRETFYGQNKKTIQEIFDHVKRTQYYYLSRTGVSFTEDEHEPLMNIRDSCLGKLSGLFSEHGNSKVYDVANERWTLKKVLRRFIWHDRIHGKAITRILEKQRQFGLIEDYQDIFLFKIGRDKT